MSTSHPTHHHPLPALSGFHQLLTFALLLLFVLFTTIPTLQAQVLHHESQQDVLHFLDAYQPKAVSAEHEMTFATMINELADKRVVFVGEKHDRYDHHLNQLAILRALHAKNPRLAIGLEWFQQPYQPILDAYLAGQLSETEMLKQSGYYERWRYDYRQLRPILTFAKAHKIPVLALNAQKEITAKVSAGGLENLSQQERGQIPDTLHPPGNTYRTYLQEVFDQHMGGHGDFERFVLVQRIWDQTMAMNIVKYLAANPQQRMVVFAGSGHTGRGVAMPADLTRSMPAASLATVFSASRKQLEPGEFDYFIITDELTLPPTGRLGVWLDDKQPGVSVLKLPENSAAGKAGLQAGDRFVQINGQTVNTTADLFITLSQTQPGDEVELLIKREGKPLTYRFLLQ